MKNNNDKINILIIEDHPIYREGLIKILSKSGLFEVLKEAPTAREALKQIQNHLFDLVILDISLPDKSGLSLLKDIKTFNPDLPVLILTLYQEKQNGMRMLKAGASGYLNKSSPPQEVLRAIKVIIEGGLYITPALSEELVTNMRIKIKKTDPTALTDREFEVISLLALGHSPAELAEKLGLSQSTIFTHRSHILDKLKLKNTYQLIHYAHTHGMIEEK